MSLDSLTPEQKALIPPTREKWQHFGLSTKTIDQQKAADAVNAIYITLGLAKPQIIFVHSPNAALEYIWRLVRSHSYNTLGSAINSQDWSKLYNSLHSLLLVQLPVTLQNDLHSAFENHFVKQFATPLKQQLERQWRDIAYQQFGNKYQEFLKNIFSSCQKPESLVAGGSFFEFCINTFNYRQFQDKLLILETFTRNCGWTFFFNNICIVCDRPQKVSFDSKNRLHAEDEAAIVFEDGYSLYANSGKIQRQHQPKAIDDAAWARLLEELNATEIDSWEEYKLFYTLLRIGKRVNVQPHHFLRAINSDTGEVRVIKIPLYITSAREAVRWISRGQD
ncbi:hypothetical protein FNW02_04055 [Komarekiella sp. 'clone 1']|uniref:DUF6745 domain-containing protein n=1 Tax=Komarekiella delphini-convector SJRDD-AB1 TaxID=2593771 RepID=A0AA40VQD1_9NOST|nr:hypothetical protein [Komarekiella delphini-convector]MBD6615046.1 hypothetical protein [Komarekiella delphini-convector SJRDD-AB1]